MLVTDRRSNRPVVSYQSSLKGAVVDRSDTHILETCGGLGKVKS